MRILRRRVDWLKDHRRQTNVAVRLAVRRRLANVVIIHFTFGIEIFKSIWVHKNQKRSVINPRGAGYWRTRENMIRCMEVGRPSGRIHHNYPSKRLSSQFVTHELGEVMLIARLRGPAVGMLAL